MNFANNNVKQMMDMAAQGGNGFSVNMMDAATAGGMAFLVAELEKRDPKVREPLTSITYPRDIVLKTGGGWVDFTSALFVNYGNAGPNELGIIGGQTNQVTITQADISKDVWRTFPWADVLKVPYVDMVKLQQVGRSLDDILDKGTRLKYNKALDYLTYLGFGGVSGLLNNASVSSGFADEGASGGTGWKPDPSNSYTGKTADEIMNDINTLLVATWAASEYDLTGMANHVLIPPDQFAYIINTKVSTAGNVSIYTYLLENNIGKSQGIDLKIFPSRWCIGAGDEAGSPSEATDRMIGYVNDEDRVCMDLPVPIQRVMTQPSVMETGYLTLYMANLGVVKFLYTVSAAYIDGI